MSRGEPTEETGLLADRSDRGGPWPTSDLPFGGEVAVGAVAILFAGAGGLSLVAGGDAPLVTLLFDAFMQVGLALGAVLGAVVLHREFDEPRLRWFVTAWYAGGILLLNVLYTWANLSALLTGTTTVVALTDGYVLFGNLGGVLGLVAGFNRGRAAQNRRLVRELEARNDTLELVNHMLRHDVLNGTQTIQGYVDLLGEDLDLDAENERYLRNIRQGGTRITNLVEDVRVVMDTITEGGHRTTVDLSELVAEEVAHTRDRFPGATVETDIQPGVEVVANTTFRAVVTNLLGNAIEHNDAETPVVAVAVSHGDDRACLRVADNGPGFPDGLAEQAFGEGRQGPGNRGLGIGLYMVQVLTENVDGSVTVDDNDPRGAVVTVELQRPHEPHAG
jgi:signal transduction histidine kinase